MTWLIKSLTAALVVLFSTVAQGKLVSQTAQDYQNCPRNSQAFAIWFDQNLFWGRETSIDFAKLLISRHLQIDSFVVLFAARLGACLSAILQVRTRALLVRIRGASQALHSCECDNIIFLPVQYF